jgi:hypothetical protein
MSIPSHQIGKISDFCTLVHRPVAVPKWLIMCWRLEISDAIGLRNSIASSTYKLVLTLIGSAPIGRRRPCLVAMSSSHCKGSMAKMKITGESRSP